MRSSSQRHTYNRTITTVLKAKRTSDEKNRFERKKRGERKESKKKKGKERVVVTLIQRQDGS
jgi:hypothetical protein